MKLDENIAAIVSGGASGLGAAVVRHLRNREVKTALFDKDEDAGCQIAYDSGSAFFKVDVSDSQSVRTALSAARKKNRPVDKRSKKDRWFKRKVKIPFQHERKVW